MVRGRRDRRVREVDGIKGVDTVRANLIAGCSGWQLEVDPGECLADGSEFPRVVATGGSSMVGRVRGVTDHSVVLLVEGVSGGPFQGKKSPPSQIGKAALVVLFAVGPTSVKADYPGVGSKEKVLDVASTLGDPLRFRLDGVSFVKKPVKAPIGEVTELQVGQTVLGIQTRGVPAIDDVLFGAFGDVVRPGSHRL